MRIALIGYGKMGKLIGRLAEERGHSVAVTVGESHAGLAAEELAETLKAADVAIDFTVADAVERNVRACMLAGVPIVVGTTGWDAQRQEIEKIVAGSNGSMVYGANFSIGVNLFFRIAEYAAELLARFPEYEAFIEERHHSQKKDSPSGTALKLKSVAESHVKIGEVAVTRAGNIPGTHRLGFDGPADQMLLEHTARNREGFAYGAIMAAEWIAGNRGVYDFSEVIDVILEGKR
ncbi:MAG TPA: dihydrodipicolinate reductase [Blastocatellia bacterium]|nr:dihydrodipicolinate reductase [Blastocatellia bacterium]